MTSNLNCKNNCVAINEIARIRTPQCRGSNYTYIVLFRLDHRIYHNFLEHSEQTDLHHHPDESQVHCNTMQHFDDTVVSMSRVSRKVP